MMYIIQKLKEIKNQMSPDENPEQQIMKMEGLKFELCSNNG